MRGEFLPYKLIGDAVYPMKPWFYSPFKGEREGLSRAKAHWNYIQSSTRMAVERAFGILKGWWRIILKRVDMPLRHLPNLFTTCICLYNLCIIYKDNFDNAWAEESEKLMQEKSTVYLGQIELLDIFLAAVQVIKEMRRYMKLDDVEKGITAIHDVEETIVNNDVFDSQEEQAESDEEEVEVIARPGKTIETKKSREAKIKNMLVQARRTHELMAASMWKLHFEE
jgi:hypothetical protein